MHHGTPLANANTNARARERIMCEGVSFAFCSEISSGKNPMNENFIFDYTEFLMLLYYTDGIIFPGAAKYLFLFGGSIKKNWGKMHEFKEFG